MTCHDETSQTHRELLTRLRWAGYAEGATLVVLLFLAVPLKHLGGDARLVSIMDPLHGLVFLAYMWLLVQTVGAGIWTKRDALRLAGASLLPFGTWSGDRFVRERLKAASESEQ
jgi:integral membrane protein